MRTPSDSVHWPATTPPDGIGAQQITATNLKDEKREVGSNLQLKTTTTTTTTTKAITTTTTTMTTTTRTTTTTAAATTKTTTTTAEMIKTPPK
jgi:hypothetical protein